VGKENEMRPSKSLMNSEERSSYQQAVLIRGGGLEAHSDHRRTQHIFPSILVEANAHDESSIEERKPTKTIKEE
jgi:hypothetical protein